MLQKILFSPTPVYCCTFATVSKIYYIEGNIIQDRAPTILRETRDTGSYLIVSHILIINIINPSFYPAFTIAFSHSNPVTSWTHRKWSHQWWCKQWDRERDMNSYSSAEICQLTMSSCSVRCTPNFFSPIVRSLIQMPPSPFTSRTWNSTLSLCSCSEPPQVSHGCAGWPGSVCQSAATDSLVTGWDGRATEESSASPCPSPPPGSTPGWVSAEQHWQNTSLSKEDISEPCWCIMSVRQSGAVGQSATEELRLALSPRPASPGYHVTCLSQSESKSKKLPVILKNRKNVREVYQIRRGGSQPWQHVMN